MVNDPTFKLAMVDVDGTLRNESDWLPDALAMLDVLRDAGLTLALCSGRPAHSLQETADQLGGISYVAGAGGSVVQRRDGEAWVTLLERTLSLPAVEAIATTAHDAALELWAYTADTWLVTEVTPMVKRETDILGGVQPDVVDTFVGRSDVLKLMGLNATTEQQRLLREAASGQGLVVVKSNPDYDDVIPAGSLATKGGDALIADLGIGWAQVVAIGDGPNDVGMLARAGLGICLGHITPSHMPDAEHHTVDVADRAQAIEVLREHL